MATQNQQPQQRISRRRFLQIGGGTIALLASGCTVDLQQEVQMESYVRPPEETLPGEDIWFASTCRMCPAACGIVVRTSNGRARKIEGNMLHPLNGGGLCARGQAGLQLLYHPDRLQGVLQRDGERGTGQWRDASWGDALAQITSRLQEVDPERVAFLTGMLPGTYSAIVNRFTDGLDAPDAVVYDAQSAFDGRVVLSAANDALFGDAALPYFDISRADIVFGFGADFLETWLSPVAYGRDFGLMRGQQGVRGSIVAFESRLSMTAANADRWIPVLPGHEGLAALALGKIIVDEELASATDIAMFGGLYQDVSVADIAATLSMDVDELSRLAHIFAEAHHPVALPGSLLTSHTNGLDAVKAVEMLNLLVGHIGPHGAFYLSAEPPSRDFRITPPNAFADVQALQNRMAAGEIDLLFVVDTNPLYDLPDAAAFSAAMDQVETVVTFASLPNETTEHSDLVLPIHTYLETWGYEFVNPSSEKMIVSAQQPVVRPLYDTRDLADIFMALANRLGDKPARRIPWPNLVNYLQTRLVSLQLEQGNITAEDIETFWAEWLQNGGWWSADSAWRVPEPGEQFGSALSIPMPDYAGDEANYPFHLLPVPSLVFGDGRHAGLPWLQETPDPMTTASWDTWVEINPETARQLGVQNNEVVTVSTPAGEGRAIVYVYPGIHPSVIAMPVGQGHTALGRWAANRGENVLHLLAAQTDPTTGHLAWGATRAQIITEKTYRILPVLESNIGVEHDRQQSLVNAE